MWPIFLPVDGELKLYVLHYFKFPKLPLGKDMPLEKGKSKKAFKHNVSAEVKAGKPVKQAVAIAYAVKRKAGRGK